MDGKFQSALLLLLLSACAAEKTDPSAEDTGNTVSSDGDADAALLVALSSRRIRYLQQLVDECVLVFDFSEFRH